MKHPDLSNNVSHAAGDPSAQSALEWRDNNVPVSLRFDDTYFSDADGRAETQEVFLRGNGLPDRWERPQSWTDANVFTIAELGFGTGLNFLETAYQWQRCGAVGRSLRFVSFEMYPLATDDLARTLATWPELSGLTSALEANWPVAGAVEILPGVTLDLIMGDARDVIKATGFVADAWFLDGFSPDRNPELWDADLLAQVYERTTPGGTFSTYTAAGWVRRNLAAAGFEVARVPGFGRKRERLQGQRSAM